MFARSSSPRAKERGQHGGREIVLGSDRGRERVARRARDTCMTPIVGGVVDREWEPERRQPELARGTGDASRRVRQRARLVRIRRAPRRLGRILGARSRDAEQALRTGVPRLELRVVVRPRGAGVAHDVGVGDEVALAEADRHTAVEHGRPTDTAVGAERRAIAPGGHPVRRLVRVEGREVDRPRVVPVVRTTGHPVAALEHQHVQAGRHHLVCGHRPAEPAADDHRVPHARQGTSSSAAWVSCRRARRRASVRSIAMATPYAIATSVMLPRRSMNRWFPVAITAVNVKSG